MRSTYSWWIGVQKSLKNGLIVLGPALIAGLLAFRDEVPPGYQFIGVGLGLVAYFIKNFIQHNA